MNQADVTKLVSKLRFSIQPTYRRLRNPEGPAGRLHNLRKCVTALIKYERIELNHQKADEARGYAERLISDAIRHGDQHQQTMEMADFWITEKQYIHKLFKVLVPRFQNTPLSYTRMYKAPQIYPGHPYKRALLELRGNPYPSLIPDLSKNRNFIHNVLLDEAKKEYRRKKYAKMADEVAPLSAETSTIVDEVNESAEKLADTSLNEEASDSVDNKAKSETEEEKK